MLCLNRSQIFQIKTRRQGIVKEVFSLGLFFSSSSSNLVSDKDLGRPRRDSLLLLLLLGRLKCAQSFVNALASHSSWGSLRPSWNSSLKSSCSMKSHTYTTFFNESSRLIFSDGSRRTERNVKLSEFWRFQNLNDIYPFLLLRWWLLRYIQL